MTNVLVYDIEAEELDRIAEANDISIADVVEMLMEYADEMKKENNLN